MSMPNAKDVANDLKALPVNEIHGHIILSPTLRDRAVKALGGADRPMEGEKPVDTPNPAPETNTPEWRDAHPVLSDDRKAIEDDKITSAKDDTTPKAAKPAGAKNAAKHDAQRGTTPKAKKK